MQGLADRCRVDPKRRCRNGREGWQSTERKELRVGPILVGRPAGAAARDRPGGGELGGLSLARGAAVAGDGDAYLFFSPST
ncbi:hypothetical protein Mal64_16940 [Pseudobythopirellula maris]|uniref:Uncharacterized protein n=1 Tax=Pseudobythopirellula maris TaxID=2527991 RepID=A0A5C5ZM13_9BACT|nr:hypothetical protein Mal64_16940 [Pseudobythopirellula maris]